MHYQYMKPRQNRSDIKFIRVSKDLRFSTTGQISSRQDTNTAVKASTLAELVIAGKIGAQHVISAIRNGTVEAKRFKQMFWREIRRINVDLLPQAALTTIGLLTPILM